MSHETAKRDDARNTLTRGQIHTVVISDEDVDDEGTGLAKVQNIKTFVKPGETDLGYGDTVTVKIADVGPSHAEALALAVVE